MATKARVPDLGPGAPGALASKPKQSFSVWVKTHQKEAAGIGVVGVVGLLYLKKKSSASSAATAAASSTNAIDPATGIPYSEELQAAQSAASSSMPASSGYYGAGSSGSGSYGTGGGDAYGSPSGTTTADEQAILAALQAQTNGVTSSGGFLNPVSGVPQGAPAIDLSPAPVISPIAAAPAALPYISPIGTGLSPQQAQAAVNSGSASASAALAAEVSASAETAAQRHAQEVGNRLLRKQAKG